MSNAELQTHYANADIFKLPNIDSVNKYQPVKGVVAIFDKNEKIGYNAISPNAYSYTVLCKILNQKQLNDKYFVDRKNLINEAVPQYSSSPVSLYTKNADNKDIQLWDPELGNSGSYVSIVKRLKKNHRGHDYFIAVTINNSLALTDFWEKTQDQAENMTFGQIPHDMDYIYCTLTTERSAKRIAYQIANKLDLHINYTLDRDSHCLEMDDVPPMLACPDYEQVNSCIKFVDQNRVGIFNHAVSTNEIIGDKLFISVDPYTGIYSFNVDQNIKSSIAMPSCTGKFTESPDAFNSHDLEERLNVVVWEKTSKEIKVNNRITHQHYREIDNNFKNQLKNLGWNATLGYDVFTTVVTKIPSVKKRPIN